MTTRRRDRAYLMACVRRAGVPEAWREDAIQDILLAMWLEGNETTTMIARRSIDAARRYGWHNRGFVRESVSLNDEIPDLPGTTYAGALIGPDPYPGVDAVIDFCAPWDKLGARARKRLLEAVHGERSVSYHRIHQIRKRLRALAA